MQDVIIVCAGSYGKEVYWELQRCNFLAKQRGEETPYNILGFINDIPNALDYFPAITVPILGGIQNWEKIGDEKYALGLGTPDAKKKIVDMLKPRGVEFISIISEWADVSEDLVHGEGCVITGGAIVGCDVRLGDFVNINGSMICSGAEIKDFSTTTGFTVIEDAVVEEGVYLGSKAVVTAGKCVGAWSNVAVGSVVMNDVRPGATVFGMPAEEIG